MIPQIVLLLAGLALLVKGGEWFVGAAVRLAEFLRLPRVVIGSTLVSLATTTPELVVSIMAGLEGESGLAVGNAVGSCICNICLILGVAAAIRQVETQPSVLRVPLAAMFGFGLLLLLMTLDLGLSHLQGWVLVAAGVTYFVCDFLRHRPKAEAPAPARDEPVPFPWFRTRAGSAAQFVLAAAVVVLGSRLLVAAAAKIAVALGIPSILIGLTVIAVGTSLPELITAITSSRRNVSDLAVGNVLGANIANLTLVIGAAASLSEVRMSRPTQLFNFPVMLGVFGLLLWMLLTDRRLTRKEGVALLVCYACYLSGLVLLSALLKN